MQTKTLLDLNALKCLFCRITSSFLFHLKKSHKRCWWELPWTVNRVDSDLQDILPICKLWPGHFLRKLRGHFCYFVAFQNAYVYMYFCKWKEISANYTPRLWFSPFCALFVLYHLPSSHLLTGFVKLHLWRGPPNSNDFYTSLSMLVNKLHATFRLF